MEKLKKRAERFGGKVENPALKSVHRIPAPRSLFSALPYVLRSWAWWQSSNPTSGIATLCFSHVSVVLRVVLVGHRKAMSKEIKDAAAARMNKRKERFGGGGGGGGDKGNAKKKKGAEDFAGGEISTADAEKMKKRAERFKSA